MTVVSSFAAADMDPDRLNARGAKLLRAYLAFAESRGSDLGAAAVENPALNPFEIEVRDALHAAGIPAVPQLGVSGYRIDFAAQHPADRGRFVLAIECDGASYHSSPTARDRDRLRQDHLEKLGWRFHRIWSGEWFSDRAKAMDRLIAAYKAAVDAADHVEGPAADASPPVAARGGGARGDLPSRPPSGVGPRPDSRSAAPAPPARQGRRPYVPYHRPIGEYTLGQLVSMVDWVESDTLLRTEDELLAAVMEELGFQRRGQKVVAALRQAISVARGRRTKGGGATPKAAR